MSLFALLIVFFFFFFFFVIMDTDTFEMVYILYYNLFFYRSKSFTDPCWLTNHFYRKKMQYVPV